MFTPFRVRYSRESGRRSFTDLRISIISCCALN